MSYSKTVIANLAISHLGIGKEISNIDTDNTEEAVACRRYFDISREQTLRNKDWSFAGRFFTLNLVESSPTTEWAYSYRYPTNCLKTRRILSGLRNDTRGSRIEFKIVSDAIGKLIYADEANAVVEYTHNISDTSLFPPDFALALSYKLAFNIAATVTAGDPFGIRNTMNELYMAEIENAFSNDLNEQQDAREPESQFILERE